jgi:hypothetical protein
MFSILGLPVQAIAVYLGISVRLFLMRWIPLRRVANVW